VEAIRFCPIPRGGGGDGAGVLLGGRVPGGHAGRALQWIGRAGGKSRIDNAEQITAR